LILQNYLIKSLIAIFSLLLLLKCSTKNRSIDLFPTVYSVDSIYKHINFDSTKYKNLISNNPGFFNLKDDDDYMFSLELHIVDTASKFAKFSVIGYMENNDVEKWLIMKNRNTPNDHEPYKGIFMFITNNTQTTIERIKMAEHSDFCIVCLGGLQLNLSSQIISADTLKSTQIVITGSDVGLTTFDTISNKSILLNTGLRLIASDTIEQISVFLSDDEPLEKDSTILHKYKIVRFHSYKY